MQIRDLMYNDLIVLKGATLYIPAKRQSVKDQFTKEECYHTMAIANLKIHVERAILSCKRVIYI